MPIYNVTIESLDGTAKEDIELAGSTMQDFTTVKRPDMNKLKLKYEHTNNKRFYMTTNGEYPIHLILGDSTFSKIKTEEIYKGKDGDPIVEGTSFGWIVHGGDIANNVCMFSKDLRVTMRNCIHWMHLELKIEERMINWMYIKSLRKTLLELTMADIMLMYHGFLANFTK